MKNIDDEIEETIVLLRELREARRQELRAARAALPKKKCGRKPISKAILLKAEKMAEKSPLPTVALSCDVALRTLYNYGLSRKALVKKNEKFRLLPNNFGRTR